MAIILGIDPGTAHVGWALVDGTALVDCGSFSVTTKRPWRDRKRELVRNLKALLTEAVQVHGARLVGIEATAVNHGAYEPRNGQAPSLAQLRSMASNTQQTEELAGEIAALAAGSGCEVVRVPPTRSLRALGLKCRPKPTDGDQSRAFSVLTGRKLLARDHHEARAYGVALATPAAQREAAE